MTEKQDGISIVEAAALLGITPEVVRKRLQRGNLPGYKQNNRWIVLLPEQDTDQPAASADQDGKQDTSWTEQDAALTRLGERYESEIAFLRQELERRSEELRRKDVLLAEFGHRLADITQRLPELPSHVAETPEPSLPPEKDSYPWWQFWKVS